MLYQSVRESAAFFEKKKKSKQTREDKQVFKWKFLVLGLGVIVVILIGICSELIKSVTNMKKVPINTTFLYKLLPSSSFFSSELQPLRYFIAGLSTSNDIKYDNSTMLFSGNSSTGEQISKIIQQKQNLLYLFQLQQDTTIHKFGMVLHENFPNINYDDQNSNAFVTDSRDALTSIIFSLTSNHSIKLDKSDSCFFYKYTNKNKLLSFVELLHFDQGARQMQITVSAQKLKCFSSQTNETQIEKEAFTTIEQVFGIQLKKGQIKTINVQNIQIHKLEMNFEKFGTKSAIEKIVFSLRNRNI